MNISSLARQLKVTSNELLEKLPELGFDIGVKAIKVDDSLVPKIITAWKKAAKKNGKYNLKYKFHADYDYFYRMIVKNNMRGIATKKNEVTGIFRRGGFSSRIHFRKLVKT